MRHFGYSSGLEVNVLREPPGPHRMRAWKPMGPACGMVGRVEVEASEINRSVSCSLLCYGLLGTCEIERLRILARRNLLKGRADSYARQ
jgi:hypothetical protein